MGLAPATDLFLIGSLLLAVGCGLAGFLRTAKTDVGRRVGICVFLGVTVAGLIAGDVYIVSAALPAACVPWALNLLNGHWTGPSRSIAWAALGAAGAIGNFFRSQAGTGVLIFICAMLIGFPAEKKKTKILLIALPLFLGIAIPVLLFNKMYSDRNEFLRRQPDAQLEAARAHPFWHSVYIGLGYVPNSEVSRYNDSVAAQKVQALRPGTKYLSREYDQTLRDEVFRLARYRPAIIAGNFIVKLAVVLFYCLCSANVGLYAAKLAPKAWWIESAFWLAIGFSALPGIVVVPHAKYLIGMMTFAALYAAYSVEHASLMLADKF
jgi:hypothetical protein